MVVPTTIVQTDSAATRVLLVDDDATWTAIVRHMLRKARPGAELVWAGDFDTAVERLETEQFDCCLLDYRLGADSGLDVLRRLSPVARHVPMVLLSGIEDPELTEQARALGVVVWLSKDAVSPQALDDALRAAKLSQHG